ncbi:MAG: hypothetical protein WA874_05805 [Chryseosolibacter sp.]
MMVPSGEVCQHQRINWDGGDPFQESVTSPQLLFDDKGVGGTGGGGVKVAETPVLEVLQHPVELL